MQPGESERFGKPGWRTHREESFQKNSDVRGDSGKLLEKKIFWAKIEELFEPIIRSKFSYGDIWDSSEHAKSGRAKNVSYIRLDRMIDRLRII